MACAAPQVFVCYQHFRYPSRQGKKIFVATSITTSRACRLENANAPCTRPCPNKKGAPPQQHPKVSNSLGSGGSQVILALMSFDVRSSGSCHKLNLSPGLLDTFACTRAGTQRKNKKYPGALANKVLGSPPSSEAQQSEYVGVFFDRVEKVFY